MTQKYTTLQVDEGGEGLSQATEERRHVVRHADCAQVKWLRKQGAATLVHHVTGKL